MGALLQALGDGDHHGIVIDVGRHALTDTAQGEGGACHHHQPCAHGAGIVSADFQALGQHSVRQAGIAAGGFHFGDQILFVGPHGHIVTVFAQADGQGGAPGAASDYDSLHCFFPFPNRFVFRSSPFMRRTILPRCIHTSSPLRINPTTMGNQPSPQCTRA